MRDDLSAPNLGQAKRDGFDAPFFWQSYHTIEQWMTRILSKGPLNVSKLTADEVITDKLSAKAANINGEDIATKAYVDAGDATLANDKVAKAGDIVTGSLEINEDLTVHGDTLINGPFIAEVNAEFNGNAQFWNTTTTLGGDVLLYGHITPNANGFSNLGSATKRFGTIYTSDLSLKNNVGDWTIVEGADDLFITNNRTNTTYKFVLQKVG
jgi:hypothetical protein